MVSIFEVLKQRQAEQQEPITPLAEITETEETNAKTNVDQKEQQESEPWDWEELDESEFPPCGKCGSHDVWLPLASRSFAEPEPTWICRKCDRNPNTKAQKKLELLKLRWDKKQL